MPDKPKFDLLGGGGEPNPVRAPARAGGDKIVPAGMAPGDLVGSRYQLLNVAGIEPGELDCPSDFAGPQFIHYDKNGRATNLVDMEVGDLEALLADLKSRIQALYGALPSLYVPPDVYDDISPLIEQGSAVADVLRWKGVEVSKEKW